MQDMTSSDNIPFQAAAVSQGFHIMKNAEDKDAFFSRAMVGSNFQRLETPIK